MKDRKLYVSPEIHVEKFIEQDILFTSGKDWETFPETPQFPLD